MNRLKHNKLNVLRMSASTKYIVFPQREGVAMGSEIIVAGLTISWCGLKGLAMADLLYEKAPMGDAVSRVC